MSMKNVWENIKTIFSDDTIATKRYVQNEIAKLGLKIERIELLMEAYDTSLEDMLEMIKPIQDEIKRIDNMELKMRRIHEEFIRKEKEKRPHREPNKTEQPNKPQGPVIDDDKDDKQDYVNMIKQAINEYCNRKSVSERQHNTIKMLVNTYKTASYIGDLNDVIYANIFIDIWFPVFKKEPGKTAQQAFEMQIALNNMYRNNNGMRGEC